ncbi:Transcriptional activator protein acu-15 [Emericellopsis cladophorae]|uniref:Transcriptional activator protein acu-15 n=1 Tax=Emericellopsis cladophorae TaxID=2686198 RepID=A0A9P9XUF2_9HYPO|nr:Transcriptional activator protein acu-15 [Emericellopsis cladophorae]KAI6777768.1 Transcriptional activator protein acu-15 [Emericellopsis cladophorae]
MSDDAAVLPTVPPTHKKRRRPPLACEQCRRRKVRCDRKSPCNHCVRSQIKDCSYAPAHTPSSWKKKAENQSQSQQLQKEIDRKPAPILPAPSKDTETANSAASDLLSIAGGSSTAPSSSDSSRDVDRLVERIQYLEEKLAGFGLSKSPEEAVTGDPSSTGTLLQQGGTISKTRYFGRSHWMKGAMLLPLEINTLGKLDAKEYPFGCLLNRCKALGRKIKEHRLKPLSSSALGRDIPHKALADELVESYLRTFEGVLRVLHVPSFRSEYERFWTTTVPQHTAHFTILLRLVMALGSVFHDDTFTLRPRATQWIYEAQLWIMLPPEKARMNIPGLQIMCLLTLARSAVAIGHDLVWVTTGGMLRKAMYMGLHRDPRHLADMTTFRAEMRRRLWATIIELNLQSGFDAGGPPLISAAEYDTLPPADLDDVELTDELDRERRDRVAQKPVESTQKATDMSVALEVAKSAPLRLSLLQHANDFRSVESYEQTLRHNSALVKFCRAMSQSMLRYSKEPEAKVTQFHASFAEILVYRCFHALHQPLITKSLEDPRYYFSRKMHLDGALKITHICGLSGPLRDQPPSTDFTRLVTNGSGIFRNVPLQSLTATAVELIHTHGNVMTGLGYLPAVQDYDLRATLAAGEAWMLRRVRSGETNIKGHVYTACCLRHVDLLNEGIADEKVIEDEVSATAVVAANACYAAMKELALSEGVEVDEDRAESSVPLLSPADMELPQGSPGLGIGDRMYQGFLGDLSWDEMDGLLWGSPKPWDSGQPPLFE